MIVIKTKALKLVPVNVIWFAGKPQKRHCLFSYYKQSSSYDKVNGFFRKSFFTKIININAPTIAIESGFDRSTAYEIRRAVKDGITTDLETDPSAFITFYNLFAKTKALPDLNLNFSNYLSNLVVTKAIYQNKNCVMHAYLSDPVLKKIRLLHSASLFRDEKNNYDKALIGRANRLLHFKDMCLFKQQGFEVYDFGGYAANTTDKVLKGINQFKDNFGGILVQESDYLPLPALILDYFSKLFKL